MIEDIFDSNKNLNIKECKGFFSKFKGLMFKRNFTYSLLFKNTNGIHTFFMFEPIDIILFDENFNVVNIIENVKPWRVILPKKNVKHTLEMPYGFSKKFNCIKKD